MTTTQIISISILGLIALLALIGFLPRRASDILGIVFLASLILGGLTLLVLGAVGVFG